jgi:hypothetical protein
VPIGTLYFSGIQLVNSKRWQRGQRANTELVNFEIRRENRVRQSQHRMG